jgi:hypothetical protein
MPLYPLNTSLTLSISTLRTCDTGMISILFPAIVERAMTGMGNTSPFLNEVALVGNDMVSWNRSNKQQFVS